MAHRRIERAGYALYQLGLIDCDEAKLGGMKSMIEQARATIEVLRRAHADRRKGWK
jgi:hypothetical protein